MKRVSQKEILLNNWMDEKEASMLYSQMALQEEDPQRRKIYERLSEIEKRHAELWEEELRKIGFEPKEFKPRLKARFLSLFGKALGHNSLLEVLERAENSAVKGYAQQEMSSEDAEVKEKLRSILPDEKSHSKLLSQLRGKPKSPLEGERWHAGGGSIRDVIFGMNDGLLSTFSLVTGVSGAATSNALVLLAGFAGAIAGAISMAAGAYVSTKSEKEVLEKHLKMEEMELETMPEEEEEELTLIYELKGIDPKRAKEIAKQILSNKEIALETMAREELGFAPEEISDPRKAGLSSGVSFILGAAVPILPYLIFPGKLALFVSIALSLGGFFLIGAGRTIVTGRNPWRSGAEMFLIGTVAAIVTYFIGNLVGVPLID